MITLDRFHFSQHPIEDHIRDTNTYVHMYVRKIPVCNCTGGELLQEMSKSN